MGNAGCAAAVPEGDATAAASRDAVADGSKLLPSPLACAAAGAVCMLESSS